MSDSKPPDFSEAFEGYQPDDDSREQEVGDLNPVDSDLVNSDSVDPERVKPPIGDADAHDPLPPTNAGKSENSNVEPNSPSLSSAADQEGIQSPSGQSPSGQSPSGQSQAEDPEGSGDTMGGESSMKHTAVQCLALLARHHGLEVSPKRLIHDYSLEEEEPKVRRLLRIAQDNGLKAKHARMTWKQFGKMDQAFPAIGKLNNGNYVILVGLRLIQNDDGHRIRANGVV